MKLLDLLRMALGDLRTRPLRSMLCMLSVAVGAGALCAIAALGLFGQQQVADTLDTLGVGGLTVCVADGQGSNALSPALVKRLQNALPDIDSAMSMKIQSATVRNGHRSESALLLGTDEQLGRVMALSVCAGTLLNAYQANNGAPYAVVADTLAEALYGRVNIVGREIRVLLDGQDRYFTVCGVVKAQTAALGGALSAIAPHLIYVPYACLEGGQQITEQVFVRCSEQADNAVVSNQISAWLTQCGNIDGTVEIRDLSGTVDAVERLASLCLLLLGAVGGVTLLVALIGVTGSLLAAAHEKTGEIGILLALGARPCDVRRLFLLQAVVLCAGGSAAGVLLTALALHVTARLLLPAPLTVLTLLLVCVGSGAIAGLLPAWRAARLDPVQAMRE